jgi:deoxyhypusine synthase
MTTKSLKETLREAGAAPMTQHKSLTEVMREHGYNRVPTIFVPQEDFEMIMYIANKHRETIHEIKNKYWANNKPREGEDAKPV